MIFRAADDRPLLPVAASREEGGQPVQRFHKELIRAGSYVKAADDLQFNVSPDQIDHWVVEFRRMAEAGVKVPVPNGHTTDPEANRGWLVDLFRDGDSLVGTIDLVGDDAIAMAGRVDVSIYAEPSLVDGKGNKYRWPITHVALCTDPVVPGLNGFIPVAASRGGQPAKAAFVQPKKQEAKPMALNLKSIQAALGIKEDLTEENAEGLLSKAFAAIKETAAGLVAKTAALEEKLAAAVKGPEPIHPEIVRLSRENRKIHLDRLVETAKITPAVRDKLDKALLGDDKALALSLQGGAGPQIDAVLSALAENDPVALKERTGPQVVALSRSIDKDEPLDPAIKKAMDRAAGLVTK